jgi:MarR family transcriptional regulator, organic hydroperoxide resistance regulator
VRGSRRAKLEDPLALDQQVCFALAVAARNVVAVYRPLLEPMGLTHPQYLVMLALRQHQPLSVRELSRLLQLDPGTLSPLLKRLETSGLVVRGRDKNDERTLAVTLTDKGQLLRDDAEKIPQRWWTSSAWTSRSCARCTPVSPGSSMLHRKP